jgi:arsenate reductase (thioredoxin)
MRDPSTVLPAYITSLRSALVIAVMVAAPVGRVASADEAQQVQQLRTVVFICEHGSSKSLLATALFNRMAEQRQLPWRAVSRAVSRETVAPAVPAKLVRSMAADGFHVQAFKPEAVSAPEMASAARVIVLGYDADVKGQPGARVEHWDDIPPPSLEYAGATTAIAPRIDVLMESLAAESGARD